MAVTSLYVITMLIILLLVCGVGIFLQILFSKKESKYPGLILPFLTFLNSLVALLNLTAPAGITTREIVALGAKVFVSYNVSTAILLIIYVAIRGKERKNRQLEKMNIQDLD